MLKVTYSTLKYLATLVIVSALVACGGDSDDDGPTFDSSVDPKNVQVVAGDSVNSEMTNTISWNAVTAATDYVVFWSDSPGVTENSNILTAVDNKLTHEGVLAGQTYYYRVQARSNGETSVISVEAQGTPQEAITGNNLHDVAWNGIDTLVAVGDSGYIIYSSSGQISEWLFPSLNPVEGNISTIAGVIWDGSQFIAVGSGGTIITSADGDSWDEVVTNFSVDLESITYTGNKYIAVGGSGAVFISDDGSLWDKVTTVPSNILNDTLNSVVSNGDPNNNVVVATGTSGAIMFSEDEGMTWTDQSQVVNENANLMDVTWDGDQFIVVGSDDTILTGLIVPDSVDPNRNDIDWVDQLPGTTNTVYVGVTQWDAYLPPAPALKVAVGSAGDIVVSDDAINWVLLPVDTNEQLAANTYVLDDAGNPYFVVVGHDGIILTNQR